MPKFKRKEIVVEAVQFTGERPFPDGVFLDERGYPVILTMEGCQNVYKGDWIITNNEGIKYPCSNDLFTAIYEPQEVIL